MERVIENGRIIKGIKKGLNVKGTSRERYIIRKMSEFYGVTFSRIETFKNTEYNFSFLQPGDEYLEKFNMYNEFLIIFSKFESFDRRIFDFVDKTLVDYDNRLDKVCIFLVSNDSSIESKIEDLNAENKDTKLIVPFTYKQFEQNFEKVDLENKLRKYFYNRDLFAIESPIKNESYFFGRKQIVQEFYSKYVSGEQSGLFGLRKIGKTSVIYALMRTIDFKKGAYVFIDCQNPSIHMLRWYELLKEIALKACDRFDVEINFDDYNFDEKNASKSFEIILLKVYEKINKRILLIFDEIEMITINTSSSEHWKKREDFLYFWQTIRAFYQSNQGTISFLVAGVNPYCVEKASINDVDNPIFSMVNPIYLELFDFENVKKMVSSIGAYMGLNFEEEIYSKLVDDYGGHPFLIRHVCSLINQSSNIERPVKINKYDYYKEKENYDLNISKYIEQIIQVLKNSYPKEYELLEILAIKGSEEFISNLDKGDITIIQHLIGYGVLKKYKNQYFITIDALKMYLEKNSRLNSDKTQEEKRTRISKRRNAIEIKLRDLIYFAFKTQYKEVEVREKILSAKSSKDHDKFAGIPTKKLMENSYFYLELKVIINKNWDLFSRVFEDKSKFTSSMDIVSEFRVDAHAKPITDEEYAFINYSLTWLEDKL